MSTVKSSSDNPATWASGSPTWCPKEALLCYQQLLTRPIRGQLVDYQELQATQKKRMPLREVADIWTSAVLDLSFQFLCNKILLSLDHPDRHNVPLCSRCRGKGKNPVVENESTRHFVLVLCGGFRSINKVGHGKPVSLILSTEK
jgi:hypothetical protein